MKAILHTSEINQSSAVAMVNKTAMWILEVSDVSEYS